MLRQPADRNIAVAFEQMEILEFAAGLVVNEESGMTGAEIFHRPLHRIDHRHQTGQVKHAVEFDADLPVEFVQIIADDIRRIAVLDEGAGQRLDHAHLQSRAHAMAGNIADHEKIAAVVHMQQIEIIAAQMRMRHVIRNHEQRVALQRDPVRQHQLLHPACQIEVALELLEVVAVHLAFAQIVDQLTGQRQHRRLQNRLAHEEGKGVVGEIFQQFPPGRIQHRGNENDRKFAPGQADALTQLESVVVRQHDFGDQQIDMTPGQCRRHLRRGIAKLQIELAAAKNRRKQSLAHRIVIDHQNIRAFSGIFLQSYHPRRFSFS
ncbi:hypothetical protein SDC9_115037 [bioreactor metagenome]|uniref:Uncharacterized protein n=1 Tax=bioreactor metagenome TaxID=1076179 RepID=A0A645BRW1_9ZZZZ